MVNGILLCQWHGMSDETRHQYLRHKRLQENYKTQMCRQLMDFGGCPYGERCRFAHDAAELRPKTVPQTNGTMTKTSAYLASS